MADDDKTIYDYDSGTVFEGGTEGTVLDEGTDGTVLEAEDTDGTVLEAEDTDGTVLENEDFGGTVLEEDESGISAVRKSEKRITDSDFSLGNIILNTYRVESDAFKGGMGSVWRVKHLNWNVDLAVKRPKPSLFVSEKHKENFTEECKNWIGLGLHPNIVSCYYIRMLGDVPTIFSEWMEYGSLESHINDESLYEGDEDEVQKRLLDIAIQFGRGLCFAHQKKLIHQDVKPDNLLLTSDWEAKVSDFGLAKARSYMLGADETMWDLPDNATQMTPSGGRTPSYCSPEQAESLPLTIRTDIYSWAVSILEMYMGSKPWAHGSELTGPMVSAVCEDYFDMCRVTMPQSLQTLIRECLKSDPEDRPHDFEIIENRLKEIYAEVTGKAYTRKAPDVVGENAASMNNLALSYLDIGMVDEAKKLLKKASNSTWEGANLAVYNEWLLNNFVGAKTQNIAENPAWFLGEAARGNVGEIEKYLEEWEDDIPEIVAPYIEEIKEKIVNSHEADIDTFLALGGWIYPDGQNMLLVERSGKLAKFDANTHALKLSFNSHWAEELFNPVFVSASKDLKYIYVVNGHRKNRVEDGIYKLHIWDSEGQFIKSLDGPVWAAGIIKASIGSIQDERYLVCEGNKLSWFWNLENEKCYTFEIWGKTEKNEDVYKYVELGSGNTYLSTADNITSKRVSSSSTGVVTGFNSGGRSESRLKIRDASEAEKYGYGILTDAPLFGRMEVTESERMDGLDVLKRHRQAGYDSDNWTEVLRKISIPDSDLVWREEKQSSVITGNGARRVFYMQGLITESDGFVIWEHKGNQVSIDDNLSKILITEGDKVNCYRFNQLPQRFRAPYLISRVHSVEEYQEELDQFSLLEQELEDKIKNQDVEGAMSILKRAREYQDKGGYAVRIAKLSARIGSIGVPKGLSNIVCLTQAGEYAQKMKLGFSFSVTGGNAHVYQSGNYVYRVQKPEKIILGHTTNISYVESDMFISQTGTNAGEVYREGPYRLNVFPIGSNEMVDSLTLPENTEKVFLSKDEKSMLIVANDILRLPLDPEFENVRQRTNSREVPFIEYKKRNTIEVVKKLNLYRLDVDSNHFELVGKGISERLYKSTNQNCSYYNGSVSFLNKLELNIDPNRINNNNYKICLRDKETGELLKEFFGKSICISDDGMYMVIGDDLFVLDWDWACSDTKQAFESAIVEVDVEWYKKKMEQELGTSFASADGSKKKNLLNNNAQNNHSEKNSPNNLVGNRLDNKDDKGVNPKKGIFGKLFGKK